MVKPTISVWSIQDVANALQCNHSTLNKMWHRYDIGTQIRSTRVYQAADVHHAAWLLLHHRYTGPLPWANGEPRRFPSRKLYSTTYVAGLFGFQADYLSQIRRKYPAIGLKVGKETVFTDLDVKLLEARARNPQKVHTLDQYVADPERAKIKLDKKVLRAYDEIAFGKGEIVKEERGKPGGRTRNLVSVYLTEELKDWLEEYRRDAGYLSKSQGILHALTRVKEREDAVEKS